MYNNTKQHMKISISLHFVQSAIFFFFVRNIYTCSCSRNLYTSSLASECVL